MHKNMCCHKERKWIGSHLHSPKWLEKFMGAFLGGLRSHSFPFRFLYLLSRSGAPSTQCFPHFTWQKFRETQTHVPRCLTTLLQWLHIFDCVFNDVCRRLASKRMLHQNLFERQFSPNHLPRLSGCSNGMLSGSSCKMAKKKEAEWIGWVGKICVICLVRNELEGI